MTSIYLILFTLFVAVIITFFVVNRLLKSTNWYKNQFVDSKKFLTSIPYNLEIVNTGSKQAKYAFDYQGTGVQGMNWALGPQPFEYDFKILSQYSEHLKEGAFVLIPVCPFSYFVYQYRDDSKNVKYYPFLRPSFINNYSAKKKWIVLNFPVLNAKKRILRILIDVPADKSILLSHNPMSLAEIKKDALRWLNNWKKEFDIKDIDNLILSTENRDSIKKNISTINEMLAFCIDKKYEPVFVLLPVTKDLSNYFSQKFMNEYVLDNIKQSNTQNFKILNYFSDQKFQSPELYINSFFLNEKGRELLTKTVLEDLLRYL
jgi:hypothetical protein